MVDTSEPVAHAELPIEGKTVKARIILGTHVLARILGYLAYFYLYPDHRYCRQKSMSQALCLLHTKRSYEMFNGNHGLSIPMDDGSQRLKLSIKIKDEFAAAQHLVAPSAAGTNKPAPGTASGMHCLLFLHNKAIAPCSYSCTLSIMDGFMQDHPLRLQSQHLVLMPDQNQEVQSLSL